MLVPFYNKIITTIISPVKYIFLSKVAALIPLNGRGKAVLSVQLVSPGVYCSVEESLFQLTSLPPITR